MGTSSPCPWWSRSGASPVALTLSALAALVVVTPRVAQAADPLEPAYVFLIDNSLSMARADKSGGPGSDVNRLAVFAARAILKVLDVKDAATFVPLEPSRMGGTEQLPIRSLADSHREALLSQLEPRNSPTCQTGGSPGSWANCTLADYGGNATPCSDGFRRVADVIRDYAADMREKSPGSEGEVNVVYLTDGACTVGGGGVDNFSAQRTERMLKEAAQGFRVNVSLMTFRGIRDMTRGVEQLAGTNKVSVSADDPGAILGPFARTLARARRVPYSEPITTDGKLQPYTGAEKVYLVGVALADHDEGMNIVVFDNKTKKNVKLNEVSKEVFKYPGAQHKYRLAIFNYAGRDAFDPQLKVSGGVNNWTVLQMPDYRFRVQLVTCDGPCGTGYNCKASKDLFDKDKDVCRVVRLVNRQGQVVEEAFAKVQTGLAAGNADASTFTSETDWRTRYQEGLSGKPDHGDVNEFSSSSSCTDVKYAHSPWAVIQIGDDTDPLFRMGPSKSYECKITDCFPDRTEVSLEPSLAPGLHGKASFQLVGNCSGEAAVKVHWLDRPPESSLHVWVGNKPEGSKLAVASGQSLPIDVRSAVWCGTGDDRDHPFELTLELAHSDGRRMPPVKVKGVWHNSVALNYDDPKPLRWALDANNRSNPEPLKMVAGVPQADVRWQVKFAPRLGSDFPASDLQLEASTDGGRNWQPFANPSTDGAPGIDKISHLAASGGVAKPLMLRAHAKACCGVSAPNYYGDMVISAEGKGGRLTKVPVEIEVTKAAWLACYLKWIIVFASAVVVVLLFLFIKNVLSGICDLSYPALEKCLTENVSYQEHRGLTFVAPKGTWRQKMGPGALGYLLSPVNWTTLFQMGLGRKSLWKVRAFAPGDGGIGSIQLSEARWLTAERIPNLPVDKLDRNRLHVVPVGGTAKDKAVIKLNDTRKRKEQLLLGNWSLTKTVDDPVSGKLTLQPTTPDAGGIKRWSIDVS